jgi:hypothetical protein
MERSTIENPHTTSDEEVSREDIISALKKRFPINNSSSWKRHSMKKLKEWYQEYIISKK